MLRKPPRLEFDACRRLRGFGSAIRAGNAGHFGNKLRELRAVEFVDDTTDRRREFFAIRFAEFVFVKMFVMNPGDVTRFRKFGDAVAGQLLHPGNFPARYADRADFVGTFSPGREVENPSGRTERVAFEWFS